MSVGKSVIKGAEEALAIAKGEMEPAAVFVPDTVDVAAIRKRLKLSQAAFAERYCLPVGTIRDWEQERRSPDRAALVLLSIIDRNPDVVADTLAAG
ncbi:helix-turn-helix domain-containing protein [Amylibacter sp. IMCC11727]|uniref:helix-turn-helix domain-containing protein n=1 Tax=Amylibacter sp. IMCC11727 TaxID=3039851 RepID=UPI00244DB08F|nr:helix-turn-helix domain-containing protein [Amylibacter sp. IMCC11727]WGI21812.1 helix-turn-helix domain-containing protein [Amylibacter sp. IMCC11727]